MSDRGEPRSASPGAGGLTVVTGATGFVGSHAVAELARRGRRVRAFVRDPGRLERVLAAHGLDPAGLDSVAVGDVRDAGAVADAVAGADAVVHAAAVVATDRTREEAVVATNLTGTRHVLAAALDAGARVVVHVSSAAALFPFRSEIVTPDHPVGTARGAYARSKAACEAHVRRLQADGAPVVSVYPSGVLGPDDPGPGELTRAAAFWLTGFFPSSAAATAAYVDVRDLAAVLVGAVERCSGPARYLAWGTHVTFRDQLELMRRVTGRRLRSGPAPRPLMWAWARLGDLGRRVGLDLVLTAEGYAYLFDFRPADQSATSRDLGVVFRPLADTFADTFRWLHRAGLVDAVAIGRLAHTPAP